MYLMANTYEVLGSAVIDVHIVGLSSITDRAENRLVMTATVDGESSPLNAADLAEMLAEQLFEAAANMRREDGLPWDVMYGLK